MTPSVLAAVCRMKVTVVDPVHGDGEKGGIYACPEKEPPVPVGPAWHLVPGDRVPGAGPSFN
jgi:hypothetical protein